VPCGNDFEIPFGGHSKLLLDPVCV
jgi:hypothetical protein